MTNHPFACVATLLLALTTLTAGCVVDPEGAPYPVGFEAASDTLFRVAPGADVSIAVRVLSNEGRPMTVPAVEWTADGGRLTPPSTREHDAGVYRTIWRAPAQPGSYRIHATQPHIPPLRFRGEVAP